MKAGDFVQALRFAKEIKETFPSEEIKNKIDIKVSQIIQAIKKHSVTTGKELEDKPKSFPMLLQDASIALQFSCFVTQELEHFIKNTGTRHKLIKSQCLPVLDAPIIETWPTLYQEKRGALLLTSDFIYSDQSRHMKNMIIKPSMWRHDRVGLHYQLVTIDHYCFKIF